MCFGFDTVQIVSGEVPKVPVVSKINGLLYERELVVKMIKDNGKCPVSGCKLSEEDLIEVQGDSCVCVFFQT